MTAMTAPADRPWLAVDPLGAGLAAFGLLGLLLGPFVTLKPNRILDGAPIGLFAALPPSLAAALSAALIAAAAAAVFRTPDRARLAIATVTLVLLMLALGRTPAHLVAAGDLLPRVGPGWGAWMALVALSLTSADALSRLRLGPLGRLAALAAAAAAVAALLASGALDQLSVMKEYASRADAFWSEAQRHVALSFGSVAAAVAIGTPLGLTAHFHASFRGPALGVLAAVQSVPSIALFGLLIVPLGWTGAHLPGAAALGIAGVGAAPACLALTLYALLPVVASVATGLSSAPRDVIEAARGAGMTERQILLEIKTPLAAPALLAGLRTVLVQTIGLATIAALIGAGGFGAFVFQGVGQTAIDLVLLGTLPVVALALSASVILDAAADAAAAP